MASLNVTTYDRVPEQPGMPAASAAPVPGVGPYPLGWASLTHRDAEYGPLRPNSTGVEFEEILRLVDDADTLAAPDNGPARPAGQGTHSSRFVDV